jgi:hypothetical protein
MTKKTFTIGEIGEAAFNAASAGKITTSEFKTIVAATKLFKKIF